MAKLTVALADLSYLTDENAHNLYAPLGAGYVASYIRSKFPGQLRTAVVKDPNLLLSAARANKLDIIGLASYYWGYELNGIVSRKLKEINPDTVVVMGGPSIDSEGSQQLDYLNRYPYVDAVIPNEAEQGFANIIQAKLGGELWQKPIDGVVYKRDGALVKGLPIGLTTDLAVVPSPWLTGCLDGFLGGQYRPMIQTSRLCPYTCAFCVSGKDRGKLRSFPIEQVNDEIQYIAKRFRGSKDTLFYLTDENFGILPRDLEVAESVLKSRRENGYPNRVFYYNDKRFTQNSRNLQERLGDMCWHGVCLSLQSDNPETLKAIKRRNLTDDELRSALSWAKGLKLKTSTELIFGLPAETKGSFLGLVDKVAKLGFDVINCYNLIIFDGIEMSRKKYRQEHELKTMKRLMGGHATWVDGELALETDEVVVSSDSFGREDFILVRKIAMFLQQINLHGLHIDFFKKVINSGVPLTKFLEEFLTPTSDTDCAAVSHRQFLSEIDQQAFGLFTDEQIAELRSRILKTIPCGSPISIKQRVPSGPKSANWLAVMLNRTLDKINAAERSDRGAD